MRLAGSALAAALLTLASATARADVRVYAAPEGPEHADDALRSLDVYGWVQPRFTLQQRDDRPGIAFEPNPAFTLRRARFGAIAWIASWARAQLEMELAGDVSYGVDAFVDAHPIPEIGLTVGQFRVPFSRQNLVSSKAFQFAEAAYWVSGKYIVDRDLGAMLSGELFDRRLRWSAGVFNGNEPARGATQNLDPYFLWALRLEATPLGPAPKFEGDLRPLAERGKPLVLVGASLMKNRSDDKHFRRTWLGADLGAWWKGASLYAEVYARRDDPIPDESQAKPAVSCPANGVGWVLKDDSAGNPSCITAVGWNVQAGFFPPIGYLEQHVEVTARIQRFDPWREIAKPTGADSGVRDLDASNPQWGYTGIVLGANLFPNKTHDLKLQADYEIRNETKRCLAGQPENGACTGHIRNNLLLVQATGAF